MKSKYKSQKEALLSIFKKGATLDWVSAFKMTGCSKLASRVSDYKKLGYVFKVETVTFKTMFGTNGNYNRYTLDLKLTPKKLLK